jgi:glycosyltransferase involved in cell wall biosynthesis
MKEKIAILTTFREFIPGYSLTGIVWDQYKLLTRQGHQVDIFVAEDYHGRGTPPDFKGIEEQMQRRIPKAKLTDYQSLKQMSTEHRDVATRMEVMCLEVLSSYHAVFTHDLIFTGWNLPYGQGIRKASPSMPNTKWLHWIHSIPSGFRDFWNMRAFGPRHRLIYPNRTDLRRVAEQFRTEIESCRVIPHPKDLRSWFEFSDLTCSFIDDFPGMMEADIIQLYPASSDRLEAKGVQDLILIFAWMKKCGFNVCLTIANQHATDRVAASSPAKMQAIAGRNGLSSSEVIFTSNWREGEFKSGLPKRTIRELFQCSNLFIFPTNHETFGLVLPEAVLAGGVLPVLNKSLGMMAEVTGLNADYIDFGAFNAVTNRAPRFHEGVARSVIGRLQRNEAVMTKTYIRQRYNWDNLYRRFYQPIIAESENW